MLDFVTCYEKLKVSETATTAEIKKQWRKLVFEVHPDRHQGATQRVKEIIEDELKELNDAWDTLKDTARRADYDELLKKARQNAARNDAAQAARDAVDRAAQAAQDVADQAAQARAAKAAQDAADQAAQAAAQAAAKAAQAAAAKAAKDAADRAAQVKAAHASANAARARAAKRAADRAADRKMKALALAVVFSVVLGIFGLTSIGKYFTRETPPTASEKREEVRTPPPKPVAAEKKEKKTATQPKKTVPAASTPKVESTTPSVSRWDTALTSAGDWAGEMVARANRALQSKSSDDAETASRKNFESAVLHLSNSEYGCTYGPNESCGIGNPTVVYYKIVFDAVGRMETDLYTNGRWVEGMKAAAEKCEQDDIPSCVCNVIKYRYAYGRPDGHERNLGMRGDGCRSAYDNADRFSVGIMRKYSKLSEFDKIALRDTCEAATYHNDNAAALRSGIQTCKLWEEVAKREPTVCTLGKYINGSPTGPHVFPRVQFKRDSHLINIGEYGYAGENGATVWGFHYESGGDTYWRVPKAEGGEICKDAVDD